MNGRSNNRPLPIHPANKPTNAAINITHERMMKIANLWRNRFTVYTFASSGSAWVFTGVKTRTSLSS